ncbi:hypothetical protein [Longimicrobium sp.]|uniref:hypothetical protein n=1 Tax=Longimicrobium sp. TaxID=2029185 RepID=UPI002CE5DA7D|nr:hypothetical protein [Longimicrobium sp.]HSU14688.1 hypothetical protein [Longimicrobium sp.]
MKLVPTLRALAGALSLAALAACSDATGGNRVPVSFNNIGVPLAGTPPFTAGSSASGTVTIYGTYTYGGCDSPKPTARVDGGDLVFRLELKHDTEHACPGFIAVSGYRADISGLAPGTYHVRVEHAGMAAAGEPIGDGVRLEQDVTVQ